MTGVRESFNPAQSPSTTSILGIFLDGKKCITEHRLMFDDSHNNEASHDFLKRYWDQTIFTTAMTAI